MDLKDIVCDAFKAFNYALYFKTYVLKKYKLQTYVSYVLYLSKLEDHLNANKFDSFDSIVSLVSKWAKTQNSSSIVNSIAQKFIIWVAVLQKLNNNTDSNDEGLIRLD